MEPSVAAIAAERRHAASAKSFAGGVGQQGHGFLEFGFYIYATHPEFGARRVGAAGCTRTEAGKHGQEQRRVNNEIRERPCLHSAIRVPSIFSTNAMALIRWMVSPRAVWNTMLVLLCQS